MTEYAPFTSRQPAAPTLLPKRTLWTLHHPMHQPVTAVIYSVATGRELRVYQGNEDNLRTSLLSRRTDAPLEVWAESMRRMLLTQGWSHSAGGPAISGE